MLRAAVITITSLRQPVCAALITIFARRGSGGDTRELATGLGQLQLGFAIARGGSSRTASSSFKRVRPSLIWRDSGGSTNGKASITKAERQHLQDDGGQVGAQDLGVGKGRTAIEILL